MSYFDKKLNIFTHLITLFNILYCLKNIYYIKLFNCILSCINLCNQHCVFVWPFIFVAFYYLINQKYLKSLLVLTLAASYNLIILYYFKRINYYLFAFSCFNVCCYFVFEFFFSLKNRQKPFKQ